MRVQIWYRPNLVQIKQRDRYAELIQNENLRHLRCRIDAYGNRDEGIQRRLLQRVHRALLRGHHLSSASHCSFRVHGLHDHF